MTKKQRQKFEYLENEKSLKMHFSSFLKGFQLQKVVSRPTVCL